MFEKEELKPIDTSKYKITETGQVLKRTKEELEREYCGRRPTEPYSEDDSPNDWANIVQYAEENLDKAFKAIAELEKEKCELLGIIQGKDKVIQELEKEKAELKEQVENRNCSNCRRSKTGCPNDDSCHNFSLWQPFINLELTKAKELIKEMLSILPKENIEGVYEITEEAEQFLRECGE